MRASAGSRVGEGREPRAGQRSTGIRSSASGSQTASPKRGPTISHGPRARGSRARSQARPTALSETSKQGPETFTDDGLDHAPRATGRGPVSCLREPLRRVRRGPAPPGRADLAPPARVHRSSRAIASGEGPGLPGTGQLSAVRASSRISGGRRRHDCHTGTRERDTRRARATSSGLQRGVRAADVEAPPSRRAGRHEGPAIEMRSPSPAASTWARTFGDEGPLPISSRWKRRRPAARRAAASTPSGGLHHPEARHEADDRHVSCGSRGRGGRRPGGRDRAGAPAPGRNRSTVTPPGIVTHAALHPEASGHAAGGGMASVTVTTWSVGMAVEPAIERPAAHPGRCAACGRRGPTQVRNAIASAPGHCSLPRWTWRPWLGAATRGN